MNRFPQSRVLTVNAVAPSASGTTRLAVGPFTEAQPPAPIIGSTQMLPLRDYQTAAIFKSKEAYERGVTRQLISLPTGAGKTVVAAHMIHEWMAQENRRVLFIVHRDVLARQSVDKIREVDPMSAPGIVKAAQNNIYSGIIVASAQTLAYRKRLDQVDAALDGFELLIISDECFPAGTLVDGVPIEEIRVGDMVTAYAADGTFSRQRVVRLYRREPASLCTIVAGPSVVTCTANHPFWTRRGWIEAGALTTTDEVLIHANAMQSMRATLSAQDATASAETDLFARVLARGRVGPDVRDESGSRLGSYGGQQPYGDAGDSGTDGPNLAGHRAPAIDTGRQWQRSYRPARFAPETIGYRLPSGVDGQDGQASRLGMAEPLQHGHRAPGLEGGDRSGRRLPWGLVSSGSRQPQDRVSQWARVDSVEIHEPTSDGGFGRLCPDGYVYNFEVEGDHTYTANGFVVHNCHHDRAESRTRIIEQLNPAKLIGLTATPSRGDKLGLDKVYQEIVHHVSMLELIARGILSPLKGLRIETDTNLDKVGTRGGEFAENELADAVNNDIRNNEIVDAWKEHAADRKRTVAFCVDVAHAFAVRDAFRDAGISADTIVGTTEDAERQDILARFHDGNLQILTNCMVLTEGYDEPLIDCELLCKPTKSPGLYTQMVGRAARKGEGKHDALIIDFVDVTMKHKLITLPSLVGINEDENPGDKAIRPPSEEDRDEGEIMDFLAYAMEREQRRQTRGIQVDLFSASQYLWRTVNGVHMAPAGRNQWLTLIPKGAGYIPVQMFQGNLKVGQKPHVNELFDRPVEQETAMALAEGQVTIGDLTSKTANWRTEGQPATQAQRYYARSLGITKIPAGATKGEVSDLIDEALFTEQFESIKGQYLAI